MTRESESLSAPDLSLPVLRRSYLEGALHPRAVLSQVLARAHELNAGYRAFICLLDEAQLEPYLAALDGVDPAGLPLYGVPFAIKDNIDLAGVPTTAACPAFSYVPAQSATVVQQLIDLGAVPTGKTNLDQFATGLNGMRSPFGECPNSVLPDYPAGGSSSGSALAVALHLASFALGTDTAGSGRVPAALNGLIGTKPTRGLVSTRGLVPCCPSLDCVSLMTRDAREAMELLSLCGRFDPQDPYARRNPGWNQRRRAAPLAPFQFGVPREADLDWLGCDQGAQLFAAAIQRLEALGGTAVALDFSAFFSAARVLYEAPGVAERVAAYGHMLDHPGALLSVIREILRPGTEVSAVERVRAAQHLQRLKQQCDQTMRQVGLAVMPTIPRAFTSAEIRAEPIQRNSDLGRYTNFMNPLDYAAVAVPAGTLRNGLPWGITLFGRAFTDHYLLAVADQFVRGALDAGTGPGIRAPDRTRIVVCGAHMNGLPLNYQLVERGGRLLRATQTAQGHRLYALPGGPPFRPALVRDASGRSIEVEVWELDSAEIGSLLDGIGAPLGLGKLELADGSIENAFICEHGALAQATDITHFGGWRAYQAVPGRPPDAT